MTALQKQNDPASVRALPGQGSNNLGERNDMNEATNTTAPAVNPSLSRRGFLGGVALTAIPSVAVAVDVAPTKVSIDDFLSRATRSEIAWYHANALAEVMGEMHPDKSWRSHIDHTYAYCLIVGDLIKTPGHQVAKVHIDDGPLLADDVTGTTAFADWEAGL